MGPGEKTARRGILSRRAGATASDRLANRQFLTGRCDDRLPISPVFGAIAIHG